MTAPVDDQNVEFDIDENMTDAVQVAYDYVYRKVTQENATLYVEARVSPSSLGRTDLDGTADIILVTPPEVEVVDYKHGIGIVVEVQQNTQTQIYGRGSLDTLGLSLTNPQRILRCTIIQPRAFHEAGPIRSTTYEDHQVRTFSQVILEKAIATDDPNAPLVAGEIQCKFCPCSLCPERAKVALVAAQAMFEDLTVVTSPQIEQRMLAPVDQLTVPQRVMVLQNESLIKGFLTAVHEYEVARQHEGTGSPEFKLISGNRSSKWNLKEDDLVKKLRRMKKQAKDGTSKLVSFDDVHATTVKSPAQIRTLLKGQLTEAAMKKVESFITTLPGNPQLAPASSSKPAVNKKAEQVFEDLSTPSFLL